jgi:hypothetical protein
VRKNYVRPRRPVRMISVGILAGRRFHGSESMDFHHCRSFRYNRTHRASPTHAPVAQLDRASAYEAEGWRFESVRAHQNLP